MKKFGFIGMGNMAQAMSEGFIASGKVACENIYAYAPNQEKLRCNGERIGFTPCGSLRELAENCETMQSVLASYHVLHLKNWQKALTPL